ncbi:MAG TPA: hypothetical protein VGF82_05610 [Terracidiphilus sp.]|jgi:hypothetical protein
MNHSPGSLELSNRVDELEKRVFALEHPKELAGAIVPAQSQAARPASSGQKFALQTANIFPTLGRAMLGIAGAYVLRALASADAAPKPAVAAVAIAYSFVWLIWAARVSKSNPLSSAIYAATSTLILAPMLWETTLHFQTFSPVATASALGAFAVLAAALGWHSESQHLLWVAYAATAITAVALSVATHELLPFLYALLLIASVCEIPRMLRHARSMWWLVALAVDATTWGMIFIYAGPPESRTEYPRLPSAALVLPPIILFVIYATSVSVRAILRESSISVLQAIQAMIAFLLAVCAVLYLAPQAGTVTIGIACLILAAAGYAAGFRYLRRPAAKRNFHIFSIWSAALLAAGTIWTFPHAAPTLIAITALCSCAITIWIDCVMLEMHGALFIVIAAAISTLPRFVFATFAGAVPNAPTLQLGVIVACATAAYAILQDPPNEKGTRQLWSFIPALVGTSGAAAMLLCGSLSIARLAVPPDLHHIAFLRTFVFSATSLLLAFAGSRWGRPAMTRLAYVSVVFVAAKLLYEDMHHGHMEFIAASIFLFAIILIAVPRLVRSGNRLRQAASVSKAPKQPAIDKEQPTHAS